MVTVLEICTESLQTGDADEEQTKHAETELSEIERVAASDISYETFFKKYMIKQIPVILTSVSDHWQSTQTWIAGDEPAFEFLRSKFESNMVPVTNCTKRCYNSHESAQMKFVDFATYWKKTFRNDTEANRELLYLKDWHLQKITKHCDFYEVPLHFGSDWLNEYLIDLGKDDYMFVYMGARGTWTPFHSDVFSSYSWSTNIFGQKKWLMLPPGEENKLLDPIGNLPFSVDEEMLINAGAKYFLVMQNAGEAIFVPSKWFHQVWNITGTISINHNWINGCNVWTVWLELLMHYNKVLHEIDDCKEMDDFRSHCQTMLQASYGMHFQEFYFLLNHIARKRINSIASNEEFLSFGRYKFGAKHLQYDLEQIENVLAAMQAMTEIETSLVQESSELLDIIRKTIKRL